MSNPASSRNRLGLIQTPDSWAKEQETHVNGHAVSSALEVAGDDVQFPSTGAAVRAVPAKQRKAISRPGDTFWKGASGRKPARIGEDVNDEDDDEDAAGPPQRALAAPSDIKMHCRDGENTITVNVTWEMSWSDVLDMLRVTFGRAVVFQYSNKDRLRTTCDNEDAFDLFCSDAELFGSQASVDLLNATFKVSNFISDAPKMKQLSSRDNMDNQQEIAGMILSRKNLHSDGSDDVALLQDGEENEIVAKKSILARMEDAPYPLSHMLMLGANGFFVSVGAVAVGFLLKWNTLSAVAAALPCHLFGLSFFVSEVEDGASQLVRLGLGFCGFYLAILVIGCYSVTQEYIGLIAAFLFLISSFWYVELCVKARGWESWFQGLMNLGAWIKGGCPLVGIRKPEPQEHIVMLGEPPKPTAFTMFLSLEERHPGISWKPGKIGMKVKHIGQCLQVLSEKGNPMGPWEEGIIQKKSARQLRKWLARAGKKTDADFKAWKKLPYGEITYIGGIGTRVEWQDENISEGQTKAAGYFQTGENDYWELVEFQEADTGPGAGFFDDQSIMHTGGSQLTALKTFLMYFARRFCAFLWYWIIFFAYFGMLYIFEYSLASYSVYQAMGNAYPVRGKFYNVQPGNNYKIHMYCKGGTKVAWDGRPPVVMEAMEGVGQGVYLSRLQDRLAEYGVCCVYDRLGFGYSSDAEDSTVWKDRSPKQIAKELMYALTIAVDDTPLQNPVSFEKPYVGVNGENLIEYIRVAPPYLMLAHSAGGLYTRQFAHDYPELVAGMVLVDPLPAAKIDGKYITSKQQQMLSPLWMELCTRFLQPVGLVYNFYPILASSLFPSASFEFELNGGYARNDLKDFQVMMSRMYERQWCPSVSAEWNALYSSNGISSVYDADQAGYDAPTIIWVRDSSVLENAYSGQNTYKNSSAAGVVGTGAGRRQDIDEEAAFEVQISDTSNANCPECTTSWDDVMRQLLKSFRNAYLDPFTGKIDIMTGDLQSCASQGCDEYAVVGNPREIYEAAINVWNTLGYRTNSTSLPWHMELYGRAQDFDADRFKKDLGTLLRHVAASDVVIVEGPTQIQQPLTLQAEEEDAGCTPPSCYIGYSGSAMGRPEYQPKRNMGVYYIRLVIIGPSDRSVSGALDNLRATEDTIRDKTGPARRSVFVHSWRLLWLAEDVCVEDVLAMNPVTKKPLVICENRTVDVFSVSFSMPLYNCPQNSYKDSNLGRCMSCASEKTSATASTSPTQCFSCQPNYDDVTQRFEYTYLKCDGKGCNQCPANTLSSPGALGLKDCVVQPTISVTLKGPADAGSTSESVTAHRFGRPYHKPFDVERFRQIITMVSGVNPSRVVLGPAKDVWNYSASRCAQLRGGCKFEVSIQLQAETASQLVTALQRMVGDECYTFPPTEQCPSPDLNKTAILGRTLLFAEFPVVRISEVRTVGRDSGECPDRYEGGSERQMTYLDIFMAVGKNGAKFTEAGSYDCPAKFYRNAGYCEACPDMTTSDAGAMSVDDCAPFNTLLLSAKDASLTYEARSNSRVNGYENAQPSALTLNNDKTAYLKIRGYALLPDQRVDPNSEGLQLDLCKSGLNCFNESRFREALSALVSGDAADGSARSVTPNEIRLVKPNTCLYVNSETQYDGTARAVPQSMQQKELCGPWPALLPSPGKCVCETTSGEKRCFYSNGAGTISRYLGTSARNPSVQTNVETVGACAALTEGGTAFLYHPGKMMCSPRAVNEGRIGLEFCQSQSRLCRDLAYSFMLDPDFISGQSCKENDVAPVAGCLEAGMEMYFKVDEDTSPSQADMCHVIVEDDSCSAKLKSPLDTLYYMINLHAETKADLDHAMQVLKGEAGDAAQRAHFFETYRITALAVSPDKQVLSTGRSRELSVRDAGHFERAAGVHEELLMEAGALCISAGVGESVYRPALCLSGGSSLDPVQPEAVCRWDESSRLQGQQSVKAMCAAGFTPTCISGSPLCLGEMAFDQDLFSNFAMPCYQAAPVPHVCTQATAFFKSEAAMSVDSGSRCAPVEGSYRTHLCDVLSAQLLVTRVDVALAHDSADFSNDPARIVVSFEDGSDQLILLRDMTQYPGLQSYYIRPTVSSYVTFRAMPRTDSKTVRVAEFDIVGQNVRDVFGTEEYVDITQPGYATPEGGTQYMCPPTTFATILSRPNGKGQFKGCVMCPYPQGSPAGAVGEGNCSCSICGDSSVSWQSKEQCDDGNVGVNDGCSPLCEIEPLQLCQGPKNERGAGLPIRSYSEKDACFRLGSKWTAYGLAPWSARYGHSAVIHKEAIWLVGGISSDATTFYNDAWIETTNGGGCVALEPDVPTSTPPYMPCLDANGLEWQEAGIGKVASRLGFRNESIDNYKRLRTFPPRGYHGLVEHAGFIWVLGGTHRREWPNTPPNHPQSCRKDFECGFDDTMNDVWKTSLESAGVYGVDWTYVSVEGASVDFAGKWNASVWEHRYQHSVVSWKNSIWVVAGGTIYDDARGTKETLHNDLWKSVDFPGKIKWECVGRDYTCPDRSERSCPPPRRGQAVAIFGNTMLMFGGFTVLGSTDIYLNDVWQTTGVCKTTSSCWTRVCATDDSCNNDWEGRYLHRGLVYQNSLWIIGGQYCEGVVKCGKLQGEEGRPTHLGDVWVSSGQEVGATQAGQLWNNATSEASWGKRSGHAVVVFDNRRIPGLKWEMHGALKPAGTPLNNSALALALVEKDTFTTQEWEYFRVSDISSDSYIRAHSYDDSGNYYTLEKESRPIPETARYNLWVLGGMDGYTDAHNQTTISFEF